MTASQTCKPAGRKPEELNFNCPVAILSLQHARCRIVVTQIPVGPLAVLVYIHTHVVGSEKPREAGRG